MTDQYTDEIAQTIKAKNESSTSFYKWYFDFTSSHEVLAEITNQPTFKPDKVYWIDGLGLEFLSYIMYLIDKEQSDLKVVRSQITRSELPSSTYHNRFEGETVHKFEKLDECGHTVYRYLHTLKDELAVIKDIVHEIVLTSKKGLCTIAIVSDHGFSCLSRKAPSKKYDGKKAGKTSGLFSAKLILGGG